MNRPLYFEIEPDVFVPWQGERLNRVLHPLSIVDLWSVSELEQAGLFLPAEAEPVGPGFRIVSSSVKRVDGVVRFFHEIEEVSPPAEEDFSFAIQQHLDDLARSRQYDGIASAVSYSSSSVPEWAAEGAAFSAWRDAVWIYAYAELEKVKKELREVPSVESFVEELPVFEDFLQN